MSQIITPEPHVETFDGLEFQTIQLPAMTALELMPRMARLSAALEGSATGSALTGAELSGALTALFKQTSVLIDDPKGRRRIELTDKAKLDQVFTGRLPTLFKVSKWVQEINYAGFTPGDSSDAGDAPSPEA